jgi:hypothetical protein
MQPASSDALTQQLRIYKHPSSTTQRPLADRGIVRVRLQLLYVQVQPVKAQLVKVQHLKVQSLREHETCDCSVCEGYSL